MSPATCALHPDRPATVTCSRCGAFICDADRRHIAEGTFCPACAARPDVDYLEAFRQSVWGKRDSWAYLAAFGAVLNGAGGASALVTGSWGYGLVGLAAAGVGACYFFGMRWARVALLLVPVLGAVAGTASAFMRDGLSPFERGRASGTALVSMLIPLLVVIAMYFDTRNRLFFKLEVPRDKLEKAWHLYSNNPLARTGFMLSVLAVVVPGVCLLSLPLSLVGLYRVNPAAHPPVGRWGQAIAGTVLSALSLLGWGAVFAAGAFAR